MAGERSFFEAMLAVHSEVATLPKDGWNDQSKYSFAKGDTVVREARKLLAKHGILWVRTGAALTPPTLLPGEIGRMSYVGNVQIIGKLWHAAGELPVSAEAPIVVMGAKPHDKSWAASVTFGTGYLLLGALNQDRADEDDINDRQDEQESFCVGAAAPIATSNKARCLELANRDDADKMDVWAWVCQECEIERLENGYPPAAKLYVSEGRRVGARLKLALGIVPGDEPDQTSETAP